MGRKKKEETKNIRFSCRLDSTDVDKLDFIHDETDESKGEIVRKALNMYYNLVLYQSGVTEKD